MVNYNSMIIRKGQELMRVLAVGDIVGKGGVEKLKVELPRIV